MSAGGWATDPKIQALERIRNGFSELPDAERQTPGVGPCGPPDLSDLS